MIRRSARIILKELNHPDKEIGILFVDDRQIRDLNKKYLKTNRPTNVISFPMAQGEFSEINPQLLGDVVISMETAVREAQQSGLSLEEEIAFLLIHGILHLLGYDHTGGGRQQMEMVQEELFHRLWPLRGTKPKDALSKQ
ncbi:MAG: rRNA maturation RNase YbeY [Syntrophobacterales bacterium]|nr:MAG: rRNA maturation RNase YbeY [Syntrophobacterales bacterium]